MEAVDILYRFKRIENEARDSFSELEVVLDGDEIIFRIGKGCAVLETGCVSVFIVAFALMMLYFLLSDPPPSVSWYILFGGVAILLSLHSIIANNLRHRNRLKIHVKHQELVLYDRALRERGKLSLEEVESFVCWERSGSDWTNYTVYALLEQGTLHELIFNLNAIEYVRENLKVLGFICNRSVYFLESKIDKSSFVELKWWAQSGAVTDKKKLLEAAKILYAQGEEFKQLGAGLPPSSKQEM